MSKLTVVTGASKRIGAAIAKARAAEGAFVVVNYASSQAGAVRGDVSRAAKAQAIIEAAIKTTADSTSS